MKNVEKQSVKEWIGILKAADGKSKNAGLAVHLLRIVSLPRRKRVAVNLSKLNEVAKANENIVVPGKVLATGRLDKPLQVSAVEVSGASAAKLKAAGCKVIGIDEMLKKDNVRMIR